MSVIIRLQGLPPSAGAIEIRNFFKGISLPPGRVHIFGGDKGDAFIAFSSDKDARQAMMLNMGYIGDSQIFLSLSGTAEMRRRIQELKIHSSASTASFTEPAPAQQAISASQPQQLPLQQDPFLGTRFRHTIEPEGQGYIGRCPRKPVVGVQDPLIYSQQLSGAQGYGHQIKQNYSNKSYPPASRPVYKINLRDPRQARPNRNQYISQQQRERGDSIALYQQSDPQIIDQGRGSPFRPMYPGNTSALGSSYISSQRPYTQLHAAVPDLPQCRMDGRNANRKGYPPTDPEAFDNRKPPFPAECVTGPGQSPWMGMGFQERLPHIQLPRKSSRGTKRPHQDESGQSPPLTGTAKRMKINNP